MGGVSLWSLGQGQAEGTGKQEAPKSCLEGPKAAGASGVNAGQGGPDRGGGTVLPRGGWVWPGRKGPGMGPRAGECVTSGEHGG